MSMLKLVPWGQVTLTSYAVFSSRSEEMVWLRQYNTISLLQYLLDC